MAEDDLLAAYDLLLAAQDHKKALLPERLKTLTTDPEFTQAVQAEAVARQEFSLAAMAFCEARREAA